jgi:hypothetical protein
MFVGKSNILDFYPDGDVRGFLQAFLVPIQVLLASVVVAFGWLFSDVFSIKTMKRWIMG